jgi:hypothetical protein
MESVARSFSYGLTSLVSVKPKMALRSRLSARARGFACLSRPLNPPSSVALRSGLTGHIPRSSTRSQSCRTPSASSTACYSTGGGFYNTIRAYQALGYLTPAASLQQLKTSHLIRKGDVCGRQWTGASR